jgi:DNA-binding NtrC family response regulator
MSMDAPARILVVDDDRYLLDLLIETLKSIGYDACGVSNAGEALRTLDTCDFQLVISDIKMPEMDGVAFAEEVKRSHPDLPVIFITGVFNSSIMKESPAVGFLAKPFRIGQMEELIRTVIALARPVGQPAPANQVLVVDDDDTFRTMLMETLKLSGYSVTGAINADEAVGILNRGGIGTVITDVKMPGMDGITLAKYVKKNWPAIPVVLVTGYYPVAEKQVNTMDYADGFLMKPFRIESITELLESLQRPPAKSEP